MRVIIVEDEGITALFLQESVKNLGHEVVGVFDNGAELFSFLEAHKADLILMDINIKGALDGIQCAHKVHTKYSNTDIVFLTSYKDKNTIKEAQGVRPLGYLIKPVSEVDLDAILMVVAGHRKTAIPKKNVVEIRPYRYDFDQKIMHKGDEVIALSSKEKICLEMLIRHANAYITAEQLTQTLWTDDTDRTSSLRELIYRLRKKLPELALLSTPNTGYLLKL